MSATGSMNARQKLGTTHTVVKATQTTAPFAFYSSQFNFILVPTFYVTVLVLKNIISNLVSC